MGQLARLAATEVKRVMEDMRAQLVKLREQAAEFDRIASRATDPAKKERFARLAEHFLVLVSEVQKTMTKIGSKE
jgi:hypothetical protein